MCYQAWFVYLGNALIATIYFEFTLSAETIKQNLIEKDGYDSKIKVVKQGK